MFGTRLVTDLATPFALSGKTTKMPSFIPTRWSTFWDTLFLCCFWSFATVWCTSSWRIALSVPAKKERWPKQLWSWLEVISWSTHLDLWTTCSTKTYQASALAKYWLWFHTTLVGPMPSLTPSFPSYSIRFIGMNASKFWRSRKKSPSEKVSFTLSGLQGLIILLAKLSWSHVFIKPIISILFNPLYQKESRFWLFVYKHKLFLDKIQRFGIMCLKKVEQSKDDEWTETK